MRPLSLLLAGALAFAGTAGHATTSQPQARFDAAMEQAKAAMLVDPHKTIQAAHRAEPLALAIPDRRARDTALASALWLQGDASDRLDDVEHAAPLIERANALARGAAPTSKLQADIFLTRGSINGKRLRVADALRDYQEAHRLFHANGDARKEAIALICMAFLYFDAKDYDSVLHKLDEALEAYRADPGLAYSIYNARGNVLQDRGQYAAADAAFRQALGYARVLKSEALQGMFLRNMARNQLLAGDVAAAERLIAQARHASSVTDEETKQLNALSAQAALQRGRAAEAGQLIDRVFVGVDPTKTDARFRYAHLTAVGAYRSQGRPDKALVHLEALKRLDDTATKLATETSNALMAARFDSAGQDAKIARLRDAQRLAAARDALKAAEFERKLFLIGGGAAAAVMILLAVALFTIRRSRDQVRAANDDLAVTNGALGKALAAKTEFLATTSHEIRTPLNGILGMTQVMLADAKLTGATRDRLTVVHGAGLSMRALVDDILDVAKMETGNLGLDVAPFDPAACVRDATAMWVDQAKAKGLGFSVDLDRCPARVEGDAARVRQIVFNLLSNALKFTAEGSISVVAETAADGALRIAVRDTGIGIAPEKQAEVFESFRQADTSTTRQFGGTGLGLSICRSLAEAMGGTIDVESVPGQGSTFTATLPLPVLDALPVKAASASGPTTLVVDKNPIARAMLRTVLAPHTGPVVFAATLAEVEAAVAGGDIAHVLIDGVTAQADGDASEFIANVVQLCAPAATTLLWPAGGEDGHPDAAALGVTRLLVKPVTGAALVAAMFSDGGREMAGPTLVSQAA